MIDNTYRLKVCVCDLKQEKMVCMKRYWILDLAWSSVVIQVLRAGRKCVVIFTVSLLLWYLFTVCLESQKIVCIRYKKDSFFLFFSRFCFFDKIETERPNKRINHTGSLLSSKSTSSNIPIHSTSVSENHQSSQLLH